MTFIEAIRPLSQEEIGEVSFVKRERGRRKAKPPNGLRGERANVAREVVSMIADHPGVAVVIERASSATQVSNFAELAREIGAEQDLEIQAVKTRDTKTGQWTLCLKEWEEIESP